MSTTWVCAACSTTNAGPGSTCVVCGSARNDISGGVPVVHPTSRVDAVAAPTLLPPAPGTPGGGGQFGRVGGTTAAASAGPAGPSLPPLAPTSSGAGISRGRVVAIGAALVVVAFLAGVAAFALVRPDERPARQVGSTDSSPDTTLPLGEEDTTTSTGGDPTPISDPSSPPTTRQRPRPVTTVPPTSTPTTAAPTTPPVSVPPTTPAVPDAATAGALDTIQSWATALADGDWPRARAIEPKLASSDDATLETGYGGLAEAQIVYASGGGSTVNVASVAHETVSSGDRTTVYCFHIQVSGSTITVSSTGSGPTKVPGWHGADELVAEINRCA